MGVILKSRQVSLDPEPYESDGYRVSRERYLAMAPALRKSMWFFDPRPEFEPTRDEHPWLYAGERYAENPGGGWPGKRPVWAPRRTQFDTPVNPILVEFRSAVDERLPYADPKSWLNGLENPSPGSWFYANPDHITHARKVLTRLAALTKEA